MDINIKELNKVVKNFQKNIPDIDTITIGSVILSFIAESASEETLDSVYDTYARDIIYSRLQKILNKAHDSIENLQKEYYENIARHFKNFEKYSSGIFYDAIKELQNEQMRIYITNWRKYKNDVWMKYKHILFRMYGEPDINDSLSDSGDLSENEYIDSNEESDADVLGDSPRESLFDILKNARSKNTRIERFGYKPPVGETNSPSIDEYDDYLASNGDSNPFPKVTKEELDKELDEIQASREG